MGLAGSSHSPAPPTVERAIYVDDFGGKPEPGYDNSDAIRAAMVVARTLIGKGALVRFREPKDYEAASVFHGHFSCQLKFKGASHLMKDQTDGGTRVKATSGSNPELFHFSLFGPIDGYVVVDADRRTVRGVGTSFTTALRVNGQVAIGSSEAGTVGIASITSNTLLTLSADYTGTTGIPTALTRRGTVSLTNGSATVTGSGTFFAKEYAVGQVLRFGTDAATYVIQSIASDTSLTLSTNYTGATASGVRARRVPVTAADLSIGPTFEDMALAGTPTMEQVVLFRGTDRYRFTRCRVHNAKRPFKVEADAPAPGGVVSTVAGVDQVGGGYATESNLSGSLYGMGDVDGPGTQFWWLGNWGSGNPQYQLRLHAVTKARALGNELNASTVAAWRVSDDPNNKGADLLLLPNTVILGAGTVEVVDERTNPASKNLKVLNLVNADAGEGVQGALANGDVYERLNGLVPRGRLTGQVRNAEVAAGAAIEYSKLNLAGGIVNADIAAGAAIAKSKLAALGIVDADVAAGAAISGDKVTAAAAGVRGTVLKAATVAAVGAMGTPDAPAVYSEADMQTALNVLKANDDELKLKLDAILTAIKNAGGMSS